MAKFDYAGAQATALRLLDKFGAAGAIIRDVPGSGPEWDPGEPTILTTSCKLAVLKFENKDVDGTLIKASDKKVYVAAKGLAIIPVTTDKLIIDGVSHTIVRVRPLNPAGVLVFHEVQART